MKKNLIISLLILAIVIPLKVKGACTVEDKIRYSTLASNIGISYNYVEKNDSVSFDVTLHNVHKDLVVKDISNDKNYQSNSKELNNFTINNLKDGTNYAFEVYAKNGDCTYRQLNKLYVNLPKYNKYYKDSICNDSKDYIMCQKWAEIGNISYEEFKNNVSNYNKKEDEKKDIIVNNDKNILYVIGDFWTKYYMYILGAIVIITLPIIIIMRKRNNYDF